ncbi:MAG TPA: hypothetical protein VIA29_11225 [Thermoanaerobaculia bacterium]|jgi:hypothetical protein
MPTNKPPRPSPDQELTDRRIAEFALEESRLSNLAYRFQLVPRERIWKNWDRTEFEPNTLRVLGLAGVCLRKDEVEGAHRAAYRALEDLDDVLFFVEEPAQAVIVKNWTGTSEIVNRPTICAEVVAADAAGFERAIAALDSAFPGDRVAGRVLSES